MKKTLISILAIGLATLSLNAQDAPKLKKSVTWEKICSTPAPLPVLGQLVPVKSDLGRESMWSVGCETLDRDYSNFENYKVFVGQTGVGYGRLQSGWAKTEQEKGKYDFTWLDKHVDGLIEQGVHPWLCLCYGNPVYSNHGHDLDAKIFPDGEIMDAWLAYVKACVKRYKGKVTMYEVWNEPDNKRALDSWDLYANLFVRTAKVIRKTDPNAKIAALGSCSPDRKYIRQFLDETARLGGVGYIDYLTYHAYWQVPEYVVPAVKRLQEDLAKVAPKAQLLQGETGCPGQLEYGHAMSNIEWTEYSQAKWDLRNMMQHFGMGIPYSVFTMVDLNYGWMMQSFGLVRMQLDAKPVYLRPKFYAVQNMTSVFGPGMTACDDVTVECYCGKKLYCVGICKDGEKVGCALWFGDERPDSSLERTPASVSIKGVNFDKPVYVDMLSGKVYDLPMARIYGAGGNKSDAAMESEDTLNISGLPLWDSPVLIINRDAVNFKK